MPYIDIDPNSNGPRWRSYIMLTVLALVTAVVVIVAFAGTIRRLGLPRRRGTRRTFRVLAVKLR